MNLNNLRVKQWIDLYFGVKNNKMFNWRVTIVLLIFYSTLLLRLVSSHALVVKLLRHPHKKDSDSNLG